jgi:F0F1-type ATP synthase assembly protein I
MNQKEPFHLWQESDEQNNCWICGKSTRQIKNITLSHEKFTGIRGRNLESEISYYRIPVYVCEDCRREEEKTNKIVAKTMMITGGILAMITAVTGFLLLDKEFWTIPVGAIVGFIWGLILGLIIGKVYQFFRHNKFMRGKHSLREHPAVRQAYENGYKL